MQNMSINMRTVTSILPNDLMGYLDCIDHLIIFIKNNSNELIKILVSIPSNGTKLPRVVI
ncbi:hypothetical protein F0521_21250 [Ferrimonas sp. YFM]|nr:hypothetical protein F0521_21250 [Ferrimonas sp. YFM]